MNKIEYKNVAFEATECKSSAETGRMNIKGYASVFGNEDSYQDIVEAGAFVESIAQEGKRVQFCYNHDMTKVCGVINELREDAKGLFVDVDILPTSIGKDLMILMEAQAIKEFSIGYRTKEFRDEMQNERTVRHLTKLKLIEVSAVSRAANPEATLIGVTRKSDVIQTDIKSMTDAQLTSLKVAIEEEYATRVLQSLTK